MRQSFYAKEEVLEEQMYLKPCAPRSEPDLGVHPSGSPERRRLARQKAVEVHPDTNAFTGVPNESVAARLYQLAFPVHTLLLALCLACTICWLALGPQTHVQALVAITLCFAVGLVGRVLIHRCHDTVRAQKIGSWTWTVLLVTIVAVRLQLQLHEYWTNLAACPDIFLEIKQNNMIILTTCSLTTCLATALINGLHGMSFVHKCALLALTMFVDCLDMVFCGEAVRTMVFCDAGAFVVGTVISSWAELCLRRSFQEKAKLLHEKMEQQEKTQQLGVRNEQLRAEKERLLYDNVLQHRGCPIDDDNRSAICRGLQAEPSQPFFPAGDTHRSEEKGPQTPSLPPGPPSSTDAGSSTADATHHSELRHTMLSKLWYTRAEGGRQRLESSNGTLLAPGMSSGAGTPGHEELLTDALLAEVLGDEETLLELQTKLGATEAGTSDRPAQEANLGSQGGILAVQTKSGVVDGTARVVSYTMQSTVTEAGSTPEGPHGDTRQCQSFSSPVHGLPVHRFGWPPSVHEPPGSFGGSTGGLCTPTSLRAVQADYMTPRQQALHVARHRIQTAHADFEVYHVVRTLAVALGASRTETGTITALRAVLLQLERPRMSHEEAITSTGASMSNFKKWHRRVRHAQRDLAQPS